jgi:RNA processing factor Prp31
MLAPKCALVIRVDALGEETNTGLEHLAKLEHRMKRIEDKVMTDVHSLINLFR